MSSAPRLVLLMPILLLTSCSSDQSAQVTGPDGPAPDPVTDLTVVAGAAGSVDLSWTSPRRPDEAAGDIAYDLRHIALGDEDTPFAAWTATTAPASDATGGQTHEHTVSDLAADATYLFRLRSRVGSGTWSAESNPVVATAAVVHDQTRPAPVTELRQWAGTATSVTVAWAAAGDDSIYGQAAVHEVRWHESAAAWEDMTPATGQVTPTTKPGWLRTTVDGLAEDASVLVRVRAVDDAGQGADPSAAVTLEATSLRVWYVNVEGTGDTATIQEAVQAAGPGDLVLIGPGRYTWTDQGNDPADDSIIYVMMSDWDHVDYTIRGEEGPEATIIDSERKGPVMVINGAPLGPGEEAQTWPGVTVEGLTLTNGVATAPLGGPDPYVGAGLLIHLSHNSIIRNCIITNNESTVGGGVWFGGTGVPVFEDCVITNNVSATHGGGMFIVNCRYQVTIRNTVISGNRAQYGGGLAVWHALAEMDNLLITDNAATRHGGGIWFGDMHAGSRMVNCTVAANSGYRGSAVRLTENSVVQMENCLLADNLLSLPCMVVDESIVIASCSDVWGHSLGNTWPLNTQDEGGNFVADPLFCDLSGFELNQGSPCLPGNHPDGVDCGVIGARGQGCP